MTDQENNPTPSRPTERRLAVEELQARLGAMLEEAEANIGPPVEGYSPSYDMEWQAVQWALGNVIRALPTP